jgi:hypothetical protein
VDTQREEKEDIEVDTQREGGRRTLGEAACRAFRSKRIHPRSPLSNASHSPAVLSLSLSHAHTKTKAQIGREIRREIRRGADTDIAERFEKEMEAGGRGEESSREREQGDGTLA